MFVETIFIPLLVASVVTAVLSRRLPASGKWALSAAGVPLLGFGLCFVFC
jgi:hypothetical protein